LLNDAADLRQKGDKVVVQLAICFNAPPKENSSTATTTPEIVAKAKPAVVQVIASDANWSPITTGWLRRFDKAK
jgi:hypothetical protein